MPTCKNDCKRYYRGDEPSPKGLGYCAHAEKFNQRRKGRDGKFWIVKAIAMKSGKRIRRWTRVKKIVTKKRKTPKAKATKKSKLKGGVHPYAGRALALARQREQERIAELKKQLQQCHNQEDQLKRKRSKEENIKRKDQLSKDIETCQASCDEIHAKLQSLGALR